LPFSVEITHAGFAARFFALRDAAPVLKQNESSIYTPHTGIECGRPAGLAVAR
jgi:hypothetical protein